MNDKPAAVAGLSRSAPWPEGIYLSHEKTRKQAFASCHTIHSSGDPAKENMVIERNQRMMLRPLERSDLHFVHGLNNNAKIMRYWFEEPYETFSELSQLYDRHVHDLRERRFVVVDSDGRTIGLAELIELDYIHRRGEFVIIIAPEAQGHGFATGATELAADYAFSVLNLRKLYLIVDVSNAAAIHIYEKCGFKREAELIEEFFGNGEYHNVYRMCMFQHDFLAGKRAADDTRQQ
jgi:diamine N-acetyltransferase